MQHGPAPALQSISARLTDLAGPSTWPAGRLYSSLGGHPQFDHCATQPTPTPVAFSLRSLIMKLFIAVLVWAYLSPGFTAVAAPADALLPRTPVASSKAVVPTTLEGMTARYNHQVKHELKKRSPDAKCNAKNVRVRKEW